MRRTLNGIYNEIWTLRVDSCMFWTQKCTRGICEIHEQCAKTFFKRLYFDDIIIFPKGEDKHWEHVKKVLERLQEAKINLKATKCEFKVMEMEILGHIINGKTVKMQQEKIKAILEWPTPMKDEDITGFRGICGDRMRPLNEAITRKEFIWGGSEERASLDIKNAYRDE
jgi:Reverse transcriptase (RNA-dependent DNA polymerase)